MKTTKEKTHVPSMYLLGRPALYIDGDTVEVCFEDPSQQHSIQRWFNARGKISVEMTTAELALYEDYTHWCKVEDYECWSLAQFRLRLKRLVTNIVGKTTDDSH